MNRYTYDLHLHSALSPCGDAEMTPNTIAGLCALSDIRIAALTDHNTAGNCPAFWKACKRYGVIPVAGMELTTAEDIHVICIFETLDEAMAFNEVVAVRRKRLPNKAEVFGSQYYMDDEDRITGEEPDLLIYATDITLEEVPALVENLNGICWPAHIDRDANGLLAILGFFPEYPKFPVVELNDYGNLDELKTRNACLENKLILECSDAHYMEQIRDGKAWFLLDDEPYSGDYVRHQMFELLRNARREAVGR